MMVRLYLRPGLGRYILARLSVGQVQKFLNARSKGGDSARKVQIMRTVLSSALTRTMREELVMRNVARLVEVEEAVPKEYEPWTPDEVRQFLRRPEGDQFYPAFVMLFYLGVRRGESLGLGWDDIDWVEETIWFREGSGLVVTTRRGGQVEPRNFNRSFTRIREAAGLRPLTPHGARHTCASLLGELRVDPRTAMEILGHSRSSVTMEIYQRASDKTRRRALKAVDRRLRGSRWCQRWVSNGPYRSWSGSFWLVGATGFEPVTPCL
jgi:integrase